MTSFLVTLGRKRSHILEGITGGVLSKKTVLKNLGKFTGKHIQQRGFPVKFPKFLKTPILKNICERLIYFILKVCLFLRFFQTVHSHKHIVKMDNKTDFQAFLNLLLIYHVIGLPLPEDTVERKYKIEKSNYL